MTAPACSFTAPPEPRLGAIVLQSDETIERDFRRLFPADSELLVSRVPSGAEVSTSTLKAMEDHITTAAALFPETAEFSAVAYGCTSGAATIGPGKVADLIRSGTRTSHATDPLTALVAACRALGAHRLALLSPYVEEVSERLRGSLAAAGIGTPAFGSLGVAEEAAVVRIAPASITAAAVELAARTAADAVFLSCTNLRTLDVIAEVEERTGLPVLASNTVLAWHLSRLSGQALSPRGPGELLARAPA